jgi:cyclic pyranopterin phosphate synthase
MKKETIDMIVSNKVTKGNVIETARIAGIMAAKKTAELIPLCHPLALENVTGEMEPDTENSVITIRATVSLTGKTGVEMEALTAVNVAALKLYDMIKGVDREAVISDIALVEKSGGKSGDYIRVDFNKADQMYN